MPVHFHLFDPGSLGSFVHPDHLDESISVLGFLFGECFHFYLFCIDIPINTHCRPGQTTRSVASELGLHCLHMSRFPG